MLKWLAVLLALTPAALSAQPSAPDFSAAVLAVHNRERAQYGVPPLVWDAQLAADAAPYARRLAAAGRLEHSPAAERPGQGENLASGTAGTYAAADLAALWAAERSEFVRGTFPNVSRTGDWHAVGHYSAMVWRTTTSVGCATATGGGNLYLVCRYAPAGNVIGRPGF
jgi:Cysteine-rich secretory protein family